MLKETMHITDQDLGQCDTIVGRNTLENLGVDLLFSTSAVSWPERDVELPMKPMEDNTRKEHFFIKDTTSVQQDADCLSTTLDAKCERADLQELLWC